MSAVFLDRTQPALWQGIRGHTFGSLFSSPAWSEVLARTYGFTIVASARIAGGAAEAAILFCRVSDLRGERVVCGPFSDYCDPLVTDTATWQELVAPLLGLSVPVTLRCLRNEIPAADGRFSTVGRAAWHGVDLTRPEERIWASLKGTARQNIRKARRNGVMVREGRALDDVRTFYRMHCQVRKRKYRLLPQPMAFFEQLHAVFSPTGHICVLLAEYAGHTLAGVLFLECGDTLFYKFNASADRELCPNDLLVWEGIRMGRRRRLARLDFGVSDLDQPGLARFKEKFATDRKEVRRLRWTPDGYADARDVQAGRTLSKVTDLLTDPAVPDEVTRAAGDALYAQFC
jgi:CelD/BcsL family acetyltransferase involved in cellulose biosynthesis